MRLLQEAIILSAAPYVRREYRGWGRLFQLVAGFRADWLWRDALPREITLKNNGYRVRLNMRTWPERFTFFLGRWYDTEAQFVLNALVKPGDIVIDVGANRGDFALCASRAVGDSGSVIAFEPNPNCVAMLRETIVLNNIGNIAVRPFGLSDSDEALTLSVPTINSGSATFGKAGSGRTTQIACETKCGDDQIGDANPVLIKIDVEGFESRAINGLQRTLRRARPAVLMELSEENQRQCGYSLQQLAKLMRDLGYDGFRIALERENGHYVCRLIPPNGTQDCDALWIHRSGRTAWSATGI